MVVSTYASMPPKPWGSCIYETRGCRPLRRTALPPRATLAEAQADLDAYAAELGWEEVSDNEEELHNA